MYKGGGANNIYSVCVHAAAIKRFCKLLICRGKGTFKYACSGCVLMRRGGTFKYACSGCVLMGRGVHLSMHAVGVC